MKTLRDYINLINENQNMNEAIVSVQAPMQDPDEPIRKKRRMDVDDYINSKDSEEAEYDYQQRKEQERYLQYKQDVNVKYDNDEGTAPNGKEYNTKVIINTKKPHQAEIEIKNFNDAHWGAKDVVDMSEIEKQGDRYVTTLYVVDNHKYGFGKPWKNKPPITR